MKERNPLLKVLPDGSGRVRIRNRSIEESAEGAARLIANRRYGDVEYTGPVDTTWETGKLRASYLNEKDRKTVSTLLALYLPQADFSGKIRINLKKGFQSGTVEVIQN
ncbi:MAG: hypothetical protein VB050_04935 [Geobacteraceae bacterium]|nr:hypothetical protein [Geobacteraceae bacterium]